MFEKMVIDVTTSESFKNFVSLSVAWLNEEDMLPMDVRQATDTSFPFLLCRYTDLT